MPALYHQPAHSTGRSRRVDEDGIAVGEDIVLWKATVVGVMLQTIEQHVALFQLASDKTLRSMRHQVFANGQQMC